MAILGSTVQRRLVVIVLSEADERVRSSTGKRQHRHAQGTKRHIDVIKEIRREVTWAESCLLMSKDRMMESS